MQSFARIAIFLKSRSSLYSCGLIPGEQTCRYALVKEDPNLELLLGRS